MSGEEHFWIGELADRSGFNVDTIRYYERAGLLPEPDRTDGGFRVYGREDVERLEFVRQAQSLGLDLAEIAEILEISDAGIEPCQHVRERLRARLAEVRDRIREVEGLRQRLRTALRRAESASASVACRCRIIEG